MQPRIPQRLVTSSSSRSVTRSTVISLPGQRFTHTSSRPLQSGQTLIRHPKAIGSARAGLPGLPRQTALGPPSRAMSAGSSSATPEIRLTPIEDALCQLLSDACLWIQEHRPQPDQFESGGAKVDYHDGWNCEARIAGGWVRDKLLGMDSHDLDVSLSSLTGHIFALLLRQYLMSPEFVASPVAQTPGSPLSADSSSSSQLVGHITKIAANPEQSKNLETATARVAGLQLDFVNLRKEVYLGNSRIPTMTFGTALEDAQRRDITINALFFNVQTREIEDLTGLGITDMKEKIVRTPLEPQQTFLDDPLRVLRCVRFASRFGYDIHDDIVQCLATSEKGQEIRDALKLKVSRERFGMEVDKMMLGPDPARAIELIKIMKLFDIVFGPAPGDVLRGPVDNFTAASQNAVIFVDELWHQAKRCKTPGKDASNGGTYDGKDLCREIASHLPSSLLAPLLDRDERRLLFYNSVLLPLRDQEWEEKKGKWFWAGESVIARGLKLGVKNTREPLASLHRSSAILHRPMEDVFDVSHPDYRGRFVPNLVNAPISRRSSRALLARLSDVHRPESGLSVSTSILWAITSDFATGGCAKDQAKSFAEPYVDLFLKLDAEGVLERLDEKPLLDGKEACEALAVRPGRQMAIILKRVEAWQFDRDAAKSDDERAMLKEECRAWLKEEWAKGGIVPPAEREENAAPPPKKKKGANQK